MLSTSNYKTIQQHCLSISLIEVHKYLNSLSPELMNKVFYLRQNHYKVRCLNVFATNNPRKKFMLNATVYRANKLWETPLSEVKYCPSLQLFKNKIKTGRWYRYQ